jgi:hypothetical protein
MVVRNSVAVVTLIAALAAAPMTGFAQSQTDRTGTGGVAHVAGQEGPGVATTALIAGGVIAAAIGIAVAVSSDDDETSTSVSTVTSTTTR